MNEMLKSDTAGIAMAARRSKLAVLLPMSFALRNVVHSGVLAGLVGGGVEADLLLRRIPTDPESLALEWSAPRSLQAMLEPPARVQRGRPFLNGIIAKAFASRNGIESHRLYRRWFGRDLKGFQRLRRDLMESLGVLAQPRPIFEKLARQAESLYRCSHDLQPVRRQLRTLQPNLVWSTVCSSPLEYPYVLAARDLGIPVVTSILSFDNLTSRPALPHFDFYLVWNERMRDQLLRLYPDVSPECVEITGTPQFDFHRSEAFRWDRDRTLYDLGLPAGARYFLYAASHESLAPQEPELVSGLIGRLGKDAALQTHWLVVRLHPLDDGRRWEGVVSPGMRGRLAMAHERRTESDGWTIPSVRDQQRFVSTIAHCDACINIVSTMTLDAAILDRPIVGIEFSREPSSPREIMFSEYGADHYRPVVESGALRLARRWPELMGLLREAFEDPERDRPRRVDLVRNECGIVDGHAAERVSAALLKLLEADALRRESGATLPGPPCIEDKEFEIA
jgi:hypothetical protein